MNDREAVIKHLEMIQVIINRLGRDSFLILMKGWSTVMSLVIALFAMRYSIPFVYIIFLLIFPIVFWGLDAYYLWQARLFRGLYDQIRKQRKTDFDMRWSKEVEKENKWFNVLWSRNIWPFYTAQIVFILSMHFFKP